MSTLTSMCCLSQEQTYFGRFYESNPFRGAVRAQEAPAKTKRDMVIFGLLLGAVVGFAVYEIVQNTAIGSTPQVASTVTTAQLRPFAPTVTFLAASRAAGDTLRVAWDYTLQPWCVRALPAAQLKGALQAPLAPGRFTRLSAPLCYTDFQQLRPAAGLTLTVATATPETPAPDSVAWQVFAQSGDALFECRAANGSVLPPPFAVQACATLASTAPPGAEQPAPFWGADSYRYHRQGPRTLAVGAIELFTQRYNADPTHRSGVQNTRTDLFVDSDSDNVRAGSSGEGPFPHSRRRGGVRARRSTWARPGPCRRTRCRPRSCTRRRRLSSQTCGREGGS